MVRFSNPVKRVLLLLKRALRAPEFMTVLRSMPRLSLSRLMAIPVRIVILKRVLLAAVLVTFSALTLTVLMVVRDRMRAPRLAEFNAQLEAWRARTASERARCDRELADVPNWTRTPPDIQPLLVDACVEAYSPDKRPIYPYSSR
jgi:hypothetical protein